MMKRTKILVVVLAVIAAVMLLTGCEKNVNKVDKNENNTNKLGNEVSDKFDMNAKFSNEDLIVNNLKYGMTEEEVKNTMGEPDRTEKGEDVDIYGESISYHYEDLQLLFYDHDGKMVLSCAATESPEYTFARGLKVGDSKEKVISSFNRETENESEMRKIYSVYDKSNSFGKYLYGQGIEDVADGVKESGIVQYAFINYYNYDSSRPDATYMIEYRYAEPPYASGYATAGDSNSSLVFDLDNNDTVTCIRWYYYPEMQ